MAPDGTDDLRILETLASVDGTPRHWPLHLARMHASAAALGFRCDPAGIDAVVREALDSARVAHRPAAEGSSGARLVRLRVLLAVDGSVEVQMLPPGRFPAVLRVAVSERRIDSSHPLIGHKTTRRDHLRELERPGYDDTVLVNERGEVTEFTYGNLVAELDGVLLTPPLTCGLLPGIARDAPWTPAR